jgi:purine-binding chemotaxis protein CheW
MKGRKTMRDKDFGEDDFYDDDDEDTQKDKYLTFQLGQEVYGIDIGSVTEIIGFQKITPVPDMPEYIRGVINLRGQVIPVIDVRLRFRMETREYRERTCIIVVRIANISVGLIVDMVNEVADIPEDHISPPPRVASGKTSRYIRGMGKAGDDVKILLDINKLLYDEDFDLLSKEG